MSFKTFVGPVGCKECGTTITIAIPHQTSAETVGLLLPKSAARHCDARCSPTKRGSKAALPQQFSVTGEIYAATGPVIQACPQRCQEAVTLPPGVVVVDRGGSASYPCLKRLEVLTVTTNYVFDKRIPGSPQLSVEDVSAVLTIAQTLANQHLCAKPNALTKQMSALQKIVK